MTSGISLEIVTFGDYTIAFGFHESIGLALMASGCAQAMSNVKDISNNTTTWKNTDVYAPDRELPQSEKKKGNIPIPDTDAPHTQLGTRDGSKGKYPQAREFDENGNPVRDIDFTDHGRGHDHPCPHQHKHEPNKTGGTPKRGDPKPLPEWSYE